MSDVAQLNPDTYATKENWLMIQYLDTSSIMRGTISKYQAIAPGHNKLPSRARRKVQAGDIVYSTVRPNQKHYGILLSPDSNVLVSTGFTVVRANDELICPEALYLFLTQERITTGLQKIAEQSTSAYPSIRPEELGSLELPLPTAEEGNELKSSLGKLFECIEANGQESEKLSVLRDVLLPKLMSGEIDVSQIDLTQLNNHFYNFLRVFCTLAFDQGSDSANDELNR